jgi:hypothetical protein
MLVSPFFTHAFEGADSIVDGLLIEDFIPNESDRNSYMSFSGGINAVSTGSYHAACVV